MERKPFWTLEAVKREAKKYKTRGTFAKGSPSAYNAAHRNEWLDQLFPSTALS